MITNEIHDYSVGKIFSKDYQKEMFDIYVKKIILNKRYSMDFNTKFNKYDLDMYFGEQSSEIAKFLGRMKRISNKNLDVISEQYELKSYLDYYLGHEFQTEALKLITFLPVSHAINIMALSKQVDNRILFLQSIVKIIENWHHHKSTMNNIGMIPLILAQISNRVDDILYLINCFNLERFLSYPIGSKDHVMRLIKKVGIKNLEKMVMSKSYNKQQIEFDPLFKGLKTIRNYDVKEIVSTEELRSAAKHYNNCWAKYAMSCLGEYQSGKVRIINILNDKGHIGGSLKFTDYSDYVEVEGFYRKFKDLSEGFVSMLIDDLQKQGFLKNREVKNCFHYSIEKSQRLNDIEH